MGEFLNNLLLSKLGDYTIIFGTFICSCGIIVLEILFIIKINKNNKGLYTTTESRLIRGCLGATSIHILPRKTSIQRFRWVGG